MSLTADDLSQIKTAIREEARIIVREELDSSISTRLEPRFDSLEGRAEALDNDVKEIYEMVANLQKLTRRVAHFEKYDLEQKILTAYKNILAVAQEAGIELPG